MTFIQQFIEKAFVGGWQPGDHDCRIIRFYEHYFEYQPILQGRSSTATPAYAFMTSPAHGSMSATTSSFIRCMWCMSKDYSVVTGSTRGGGKDPTHHYAPVNAAASFSRNKGVVSSGRNCSASEL